MAPLTTTDFSIIPEDFNIALVIPQDMMRVMEHESRAQERPPYNLRTNFDATKEAMAYVEQGGWLRSEDRIAEDWEGARRWLAQIEPDEDVRRTVYGDGGLNRWYVHADGSVSFSRFHATPTGLLRAQEKGFSVV